ncbi:hypothetical protein COU00_01470 [Candidatus Falkowbacteria bacterium CG10_big_fil_rev_8_21_14_0_10_43_11]|uniref:Uncharacterized protein n=1 Tax=Candidatus Falkowbacteria bacterium CG10_big_fil_rev_8_21_14_0_10_43_11 TaxID=1974568 RepID=A0A2M6WMG3_9BACT|nr:MAG: hypothetical protein COU00_01470 [Candidatus Falkowbacteria bacterium CG10_big_fil_rev_8_21_14_0_10_43_11]
MTHKNIIVTLAVAFTAAIALPAYAQDACQFSGAPTPEKIAACAQASQAQAQQQQGGGAAMPWEQGKNQFQAITLPKEFQQFSQELQAKQPLEQQPAQE